MMRSQSFLAMGEEQNVTWTTVKLGLLLLVAILLLQLQVHAVQDFSGKSKGCSSDNTIHVLFSHFKLLGCAYISCKVTSPLSQTRTDNKSHSTASNEEEPFLLFHFVHTTSENTFTIRNLKAVESVFFHHPNASVIVHTKNMTSKPFQNLIRAGYNISTHPFDLEPIISELLRSAPINQTHARQFLQNIPAYSTTKFWYTNQSNLLRLALLYTQGGVYLGKYRGWTLVSVCPGQLTHGFHSHLILFCFHRYRFNCRQAVG